MASRELLVRRLDAAFDDARLDGTYVAVLVVELDELEQINRTLGQSVGDELLVRVGQRLSNWSRASDAVGVIAPGRFAILLPSLRAATSISARVEQLVEDMVMTIGTADRRRNVTVSVGGAVYPAHSEQAEDLLDRAQHAAERVRDAGGNDWAWHAPPTNHDHPD
ncbi:GGDEF domain-containing protein [Nocardioides bizhenqiangii]|uniref:GGDEF domain-containing protein n=1 Tax=Nocardioides bizhenqiangii TaxID=3095076 RepID=A0ABZ0ZNH9_9ACTN|nr:GGDEF domain-containing protein [Nocardioides sp. HM61]WQQ25354.1 GGDEF domain-containing protein [Nocardioides sp. HM61]